MYTMTGGEFWGIVVIAIILGIVGWDLGWTALASDEKAKDHFSKATTKRKLVWVGVAALAVFAIVGWIY